MTKFFYFLLLAVGELFSFAGAGIGGKVPPGGKDQTAGRKGSDHQAEKTKFQNSLLSCLPWSVLPLHSLIVPYYYTLLFKYTQKSVD